MLRTIVALALFFALSARPALAQDCKPYFFSLINRAEGQAAPDWKAVLEHLHYVEGVPKNPVPGQPPVNAPFNNLTVMIDAGGNARGRVWVYSDFPTVDGNGNQWFTHEYQVIADGPTPGSFVWAWQDKGGGPARSCAAAAPAPVPSPQPPQTPAPVPVPDYSAQIAELNAAIAALRAELESKAAELERKSREAAQAAVDALTFDCQTGRTGPGFLSHGHPCTVTVKK